MNLETIDAALPAMTEPTFRTPEEAIAFSRIIKSARYSVDVDACMGAVIRTVDWTYDTLTLHLEKIGKSIQFRCEEQTGAEISILDRRSSSIRDDLPSKGMDAALVRLAGREFLWKKSVLANALCGNKILKVQPMKFRYLLTVDNNDVLMVSILIDLKNDRPFLFWWPAR